jgi:hypothetical protein
MPGCQAPPPHLFLGLEGNPKSTREGGRHSKFRIPNSEFSGYSSIRTDTTFDTPGSSMVMP